MLDVSCRPLVRGRSFLFSCNHRKPFWASPESPVYPASAQEEQRHIYRLSSEFRLSVSPGSSDTKHGSLSPCVSFGNRHRPFWEGRLSRAVAAQRRTYRSTLLGRCCSGQWPSVSSDWCVGLPAFFDACLVAVMDVAKTLQVAPVSEQTPASTMRDNMIDDGCEGASASAATGSTERFERKVFGA
jgi:hypothetical protein